MASRLRRFERSGMTLYQPGVNLPMTLPGVPTLTPRLPGVGPRFPGVTPFNIPITLTALPQTVNLRLYRGDDFIFTLTVTDDVGNDLDLTGYEVRAHIRSNTESDVIAGEFDLDVVFNVITLHLTNATSRAIPLRSVWDCETIDTDDMVLTLTAGGIDLTPDVTRPPYA
jgi:hypothetical protein